MEKSSDVVERTPDEVIEFLWKHKDSHIKHCNVLVVRFDLEREHVISQGQRERLDSALTVAAANNLSYEFLHNDPSPETLEAAAKVLKESPNTTKMNKRFAKVIEDFLSLKVTSSGAFRSSELSQTEPEVSQTPDQTGTVTKTLKEIKEFLEREEFLKQLKECDIRGLGTDLLRKGVIDKDEADDIGFKKGAREATNNLYMILQGDKSTKKLLALKECLYANLTKETHKDLADMISKFLGIAVHESTPQSKKMKREDENVRGADDESDNEDDDDMGDPDVIKEFLGTILNDLKERSNIKDVAQQLHSKKVVKRGQYDRLADAEVEAAGGLLYGFLIGDPSLRKLRCLRDILLEDSGEQNKALGRKIRKFLTRYKDTPVKPTILDLQYVTESVAVIHSNGICRRLGVSEVVLSQADQTYPLNTAGAPGKRFMYGLQDWYNGNGVLNGRAVPVTLSVLCKVLEESRCRSVAEGLRKQRAFRASELSQTEPQVSQTPDQTGTVTSMASTEIPPREVREFLQKSLHPALKRCDVRRVADHLRTANVISVDECDTLRDHQKWEDANRFLYSLLEGDPCCDKLETLCDALQKDTTHRGHRRLAELIDQFLQVHQTRRTIVSDHTQYKEATSVDMSLKLTLEVHMDKLQTAVISEVPYKWREIATAFGFTYSKMEIIESNNSNDQTRMFKMFSEWLRMSKGTGKKARTLQTVCDVLKDRDCVIEADKLINIISKSGMASTEIPSTERVREFLSETVHSFLGRCDFKRVAASLRAANVISAGEFQRLQACPLLEDANRFLYSLLDGDPSTRKLGALSAALKVDTTHDGHQELAQLIDQFLQGYTDNTKLLDSQEFSDLLQEEGMASTEIPPRERVREFLDETVHSFLGRCDFKRVGASLTVANVISVGEFQRLQACPQLEDANRFLYSLLDGDPSTRKLGALSAALKDDTTHDGHQELAQLIDQFLQGYTDDTKLLDSQEFSDLLQEEGAITLQITKCTTIGPPRKGKTHLKYLLTNQLWDYLGSTVAMVAPEWVEVCSSSKDSIWELYDRTERENHILQDMKGDIYKPKDQDSSKLAQDEEDLTDDSKIEKVPSPKLEQDQLTHKAKPGQEEGTSLDESNVESLEHAAEQSDSKSPSSGLQLLNDAYSNKEEEYRKTLQRVKKSKTRSHKEQIIHFIDTGGQAIYHDVHPVLITSPSVYLLVFSLKDLRDNPSADFLSHDLLVKALRSIQTLGTKQPEDGKHLKLHPKYPKIFIVGTHLDQIKDHDKFLPKVHDKVEASLKNKPYSAYVCYDTNGRSFWSVDNTKAGKAEKAGNDQEKYCNGLRRRVQSGSTTIEVTLLPSWYLLEHFTHQHKQKCLLYSDLKEFSSKHKLVQKKHFRTMVHLFHILGFYYYKIPRGYTEEESIIFTDPNVLYRMTSKLLQKIENELKSNAESKISPKNAINVLKYLETMDDLKDTEIDPKWFVALLEELFLIAKIETPQSLKASADLSPSSWIVPAALPRGPKAVPSDSSLLFTLIAPITKSIPFIPSGLFCSLMASLTSRGWRPVEFCRNYAVFAVLESCYVTIREHDSFIEVSNEMIGQSSEEEYNQVTVRETISKRLSEIQEVLYKDRGSRSDQHVGSATRVCIGFLCRCDHDPITGGSKQAAQFHFAEYLEDDQNICAECTEPKSDYLQNITEEQLRWFFPFIQKRKRKPLASEPVQSFPKRRAAVAQPSSRKRASSCGQTEITTSPKKKVVSKEEQRDISL